MLECELCIKVKYCMYHGNLKINVKGNWPSKFEIIERKID